LRDLAFLGPPRRPRTKPDDRRARTPFKRYETTQDVGGGLVATFDEQPERTGLRSWSRTRWLMLAVLLAAIVVAVVLILTYTGGSSGGGGGGY
jgi:hypothetical protein